MMIPKANFTLRRAKAQDMMLYFQWANDPSVRQNAFHPEPIMLESHKIWFEQKITDHHSYLYLLEKDSIPVGQIRFDMTDNGKAEIDFSVAAEFRGQGLGAVILRHGVDTLVHDVSNLLIVQGTVKKENSTSCQAFLRAGFIEQHSTTTGALVRHFYCRIDGRAGR